MTDSTRKPGSVDTQPAGGTVRNAGRRRLLQAGIAAAPVIMTVASRPVLAGRGPAGGPAFCQSPSGMLSGNLSNPGGEICAGLTPDYWKNYAGQGGHPWPSPYSPVDQGNTPASLFRTDFYAEGRASSYRELTLLEVLGLNGNANGAALARHIVAALLNASTTPPLVPLNILDVATIKSMWNEWAQTGHYSLNATVQWDEGQIIAYLGTTQSV